jgi:archaetidylinositol phosphate synthase
MDHIREHRSLLAAAEKRLLIRIARCLPLWINSDHLTLLALISMVGAGAAFAGIRTTAWSAVGFVAALAANWFGDSLDGTVARVRNHQRPRYGYYVDHVVDLAGTAALVGGMAASGMMTPTIAIAVLAAYFLVSAESYLATHSVGVFRISFGGVGPTELRILLAIGAIVVAVHPWANIAGRQFLLMDVSGIVAIVGLGAAFTASAIRNARALYIAEPLPRSRDGSLKRMIPSCL